jgi:nitroreductase
MRDYSGSHRKGQRAFLKDHSYAFHCDTRLSVLLFLPKRRGLRYAGKIITSASSGPSLKRKEHCMAEYMDLLNKRRSIRDYEDKEVALETIMDMIRESCLAPSSSHGQPWQFIVVTNREMIKRLSDESKRNLIADMERNPASPSRNYEAVLRDKNFNIFYNAPSLVFIGGSRGIRSLQVDCALAACYLMFAACERNLGSCWIGLGKFILDPEVRRLIGMPKDYEIVAPVILGYPGSIPDIPQRNDPQILMVVQ